MLNKKEFVIVVLVPLFTAIVGAAAGAYFNNSFALAAAPERTDIGTKNLLGLIAELKAKVTQSNAPEEVKDLLSKAENQARALETNLSRVRSTPEDVSLEADFWISVGEGGTLGGTTPFGLQKSWSKGVYVRVAVAGEVFNLTAGVPLKYLNLKGESCSLSYVKEWKSESGALYGFKTVCVKN
ncbi:hypothetical protein [Alkalimarinus coralli]|uniref:hypothetical protein n=1 Tax=Alkalimarinus coralli TaxID=2935863 RepID=UPI00202AF3FC|nr:hypothetical protein [Alkalimarinus coralli]